MNLFICRKYFNLKSVARCWKISLSLTITIVMMIFLHNLKMFKQFVEINSTSLLRQFADISENERRLLFIKDGEKTKLLETYGLCWNACECGMHCRRFLSNVKASVCGNSINIPNRAWDKYWASAVFWDTKLNRNAINDNFFRLEFLLHFYTE